jgi:hypothetical protein
MQAGAPPHAAGTTLPAGKIAARAHMPVQTSQEQQVAGVHNSKAQFAAMYALLMLVFITPGSVSCGPLLCGNNFA